jgi:hypothetical protein
VKCNLGTVDRAVRIVGGVLLIACGLLLVRSALGIALALIGAVIVFSGAVGFCHVYKFFGIRTSK